MKRILLPVLLLLAPALASPAASEPVLVEEVFTITSTAYGLHQVTFPSPGPSEPCEIDFAGTMTVVPLGDGKLVAWNVLLTRGTQRIELQGVGVEEWEDLVRGTGQGRVVLSACGETNQVPVEVLIFHDCTGTYYGNGVPVFEVTFTTLDFSWSFWGPAQCETRPLSGAPIVDETDGAVIAPVAAGTQGAQVACVGTVQVTLTNGGSLPLPGVRAGNGPCSAADPPCDPYVGKPGVASCVGNPVACCTPLHAPTAAEPAHLCLRETLVRVDANRDGLWDLVLPAAAAREGPCD